MLLEHAWAYGTTDFTDLVEWDDQLRVGFMGFSRRYSLLHHLDNPNTPCVADISVTARRRRSNARE